MVSKTTTILKYKAYYRTIHRSFRLCLAVTFIFFILPISTSLSNIYYCDPIKGNTITGDGSICLIIDVLGIMSAQKSQDLEEIPQEIKMVE